MDVVGLFFVSRHNGGMEAQMNQSAVFETIYQDYLKDVASLDLNGIAGRLGLEVAGNVVRLSLFGRGYNVSAQGIADDQGERPSHAVSVILCKYLLMCPEDEPVGADWVTYKDFRDAAPFATGFANSVEKPIARLFAGCLDELRAASGKLGGFRFDAGVSCDLSIRFDALPRVPVLLLFNDRDEDFPAQCSLLFERCAERYLDMECLAMVGLILAEWLKRLHG